MNDSTNKQTIAIAGASGFVGKALIEELKNKFNIVGLSRSASHQSSEVTWRCCDLFSLKETENALANCDIAVYLVHSMLPTARLTQGRFDDLDLIIADNFARAAAKNSIKKIFYLGGLIAEGELSLHLQSRREVEDVLASHGVPCTTLRAGLIVGPSGSSFEMMKKLVERLPMMVCPKWTSTLTQPIALEDVTSLLAKVIDDQSLPAQAYDIGGPEVLSYIDMMKTTAELLHKRRLFIPVLFFSPKLSRLWVRLVTGAPAQLIGPLVESLRHPMVCRDNSLIARYGFNAKSFREAFSIALNRVKSATKFAPPKFEQDKSQTNLNRLPVLNTVCSIQRLPLPVGLNAAWVASKYATWLIEFLYPIIRVEQDQSGSLSLFLRLGFKRFSWEMLNLRYAPERSTPHRQLFYIHGGLLLSANAAAKGRLEFREVLNGRFVVAAIFDFIPALPWWIYKHTQAYLHLFVMWAFKAELARYIQKSKRHL